MKDNDRRRHVAALLLPLTITGAVGAFSLHKLQEIMIFEAEKTNSLWFHVSVDCPTPVKADISVEFLPNGDATANVATRFIGGLAGCSRILMYAPGEFKNASARSTKPLQQIGDDLTRLKDTSGRGEYLNTSTESNWIKLSNFHGESYSIFYVTLDVLDFYVKREDITEVHTTVSIPSALTHRSYSERVAHFSITVENKENLHTDPTFTSDSLSNNFANEKNYSNLLVSIPSQLSIRSAFPPSVEIMPNSRGELEASTQGKFLMLFMTDDNAAYAKEKAIFILGALVGACVSIIMDLLIGAHRFFPTTEQRPSARTTRYKRFLHSLYRHAGVTLAYTVETLRKLLK